MPVICLLQDEDEFVDELESPDRDACWAEIRRVGEAVDCFVAVSEFFARKMKTILHLSESRLRVVQPGICLESVPEPAPVLPPPTVGYLSRLSHDKGVDLLADAFVEVRLQSGRDVRLLLAGGRGPGDGPVVDAMQSRLADAGCSGSVTFVDGFDREARSRFYKELTVLAVPERRDPAFRLYTLEALAHGVPVVAPDRGFFKDLAVTLSSGLTLYSGDTPANLAQLLVPLVSNTQAARQQGLAGRAAVRKTLTARLAAAALIDIIKDFR